jgi:predicted tellurium resistance membrane protein TerC
MDFSILFTSAGALSLLSLTLMEIILGVDNIIFISIIADKLPKEKQAFARNLGLLLAMVVRIGLLLIIGIIIAMDEEKFGFLPSLLDPKHFTFSIKELILLAGGIFLMYKSVTEMHDKIAGSESEMQTKGKATLSAIILQIVLVDIIFSIDSILTAIGIVKEVPIMIAAVVLSMGVMFIFAGKISTFINNRPTIKMLALAFLVMIGFVLVAEALNYHFPKELVYFAMAFSLLVEFLNIRMRKKKGKEEH